MLVPSRRRAPRVVLTKADSCAVIALAVFVFAVPASALDAPSITGIGIPSTPGGGDKRLSLFLGVAYGTDSNPRYEDDATATQQDVLEAVGGFVYNGGNAHKKAQLAYQGRMDQYTTASGLDQSEHAMYFEGGTQSEKLKLGVKGKYTVQNQPRDLTAYSTSVTDISWTEVGFAPYISLGTGRTEISAEYVHETLDYASSELVESDLTDVAISGELRWWSHETKHWFLHADSGTIERGDDAGGYDYQRMYLGLRTESPRKSGMMVGVGTQNLTGFVPVRDDYSNTYGILRSSWVLGEGRSGLDVAAVMSSEPSANSAFKDVLGLQLRYRQSANRNFNWSIGVRSETATMSDDSSEADGYSRLIGDAQLNFELGSPGRAHGRFYISLSYESRDATGAVTSDYAYERTKMLFGLALLR